jgi:hypothetical protein
MLVTLSPPSDSLPTNKLSKVEVGRSNRRDLPILAMHTNRGAIIVDGMEMLA